MISKSIIKTSFLVSLFALFAAGCSLMPAGSGECTLDDSGPKYECWGGLSLQGERCLLHWRDKGSDKEWSTNDRYYRYKRKVRDVKLEYSCIQKLPREKSPQSPGKP